MLCQHPPSDIALWHTSVKKFNTHTKHGLYTCIAKGNTLCRDCFSSTTKVCERSGPDSLKNPSSALAQTDRLNHCLCLELCKPNFSVISAAATASKTSCSTAGNQHARIVRLVLERSLRSTTRNGPSIHQKSWRRMRRISSWPSTSHTTKCKILHRFRRFQPPISSSRSRQPRTPVPRTHCRRQIPPVKPLHGSFKCFSASAP